MGDVFSEQETLEFEDQEVQYVGDLEKECVKSKLVDLVVLTRFQATMIRAKLQWGIPD